MIDTLLKNKSRFFAPEIWKSEGLASKSYVVITLHRPSNVDDAENLINLLQIIVKETKDKKVVFPVHPRTRKTLEDANYQAPEKLIMVDPLSYLEFNYLVENSFAVITDSGGITEETTVLGIPCLTLRDTTERPETVSIGTNELIGTDPDAIKPAIAKLFTGKWKKGEIPELWDGKTGKRIAEALLEIAQW
jgi:UDP-N-acetylglucosamine 2-epimerase (non-hydrolysing)